MKKPVIVFDEGNCRVVTEDDSNNVFYTDDRNPDNDCDHEVVKIVVDMYNKGKELMEIDAYLLDEGRCTQDAREIMVEGLYPLYFPTVYVMLGQFTFLEQLADGEFKTIIHRIDEIKGFDTYDEAETYAEEQIENKFEGYLIPQVYSGKIEMEK